MKFKILLFLCFISLIITGQNQIVNYSPNDNLKISSFKISKTSNRIAINVYPLPETIIYDILSGDELKRLTIGNTTPLSVNFDEGKNLIIVENTTSINTYDGLNYNKIGTYEIPNYYSSSFYSEFLGKFLFLESESILLIDVITGNKESITRNNPKSYGYEAIKVHDKMNLIAELTEGKLILYKGFNETKTISTTNVLDFAFGDESIIVLKEFERSKVAVEFFDFNGSSLAKQNNFDSLFLKYPNTNSIQSVNSDLVFYGAYESISLLPKQGNPSKYSFKADIKDYQFIYGLGFGVNYGKSLEINNFEGAPLFKFNVNSVYNQSGIYSEEKDIFNENDFVVLSENKILFPSKNPNLPDVISLDSPYVNDYAKDGNLLCFATRDNKIRIWDLENKLEISSIQTTGAYPRLLSISMLNNILVFFSSTENAIVVHNLTNNQRIDTINFKEELPTSIDLKNDWLAVGTSKGDYNTWRINKGSLVQELEKAVGLGGPITSIEILDSKLLIASLGRILTVSLSKPETNKINILKGHQSYIQDLSIDNSNQFLLSSSIDGAINLWDIKSNNLIETYNLDSTWVNHLHFHKDFTITSNGPGNFGNIISKTELADKLRNPKPELIIQSSNSTVSRQLRFSPDGKLIASIDGDKIKVREVLTGFLVSEFVVKNTIVNDFVFDKDGKSIIVASGNAIEFFDHITGKSKKYLDYSTQNRSIHHVEVFKNKNVFIANNIHGWHQPLFLHSNSGMYLGELNINPETEKDRFVINVKVSDDDNIIATYGSHFIKLFSVDNELKTKQILAIPRIKKDVNNTYWNNLIDFSSDGKYFSYVEFDGSNSTVVYDIANKKEVYNKAGKLSKFGDNNDILLMTSNTQVQLKNLISDKDQFFTSNTNHIDLISAIDYDENEKLFATSDAWGNLKIWNKNTGKTITEIDRFSNDIYTSEISPKGDFIAYTNKKGIFLFNLKEFKTIRLEGSSYPYFGVFSKDNNYYYFRDKIHYKVIDLNTLNTEIIFDTEVKSDVASGAKLSEDNSLLLFEDKSINSIKIYNIETKTKIAEIDKRNISNYTLISSYKILNTHSLIMQAVGLTNEGDDRISLELFEYNIKTKKVKTFSHKRFINVEPDFKDVRIRANTAVNEVSPNKKLYAYQEDYHLKIENLNTNDILYDKYIKGFNLKFGRFTKDNLHLILGFENGMVQILSTIDFKVLKTFQGTLDDIASVDLKGRYLMLLGANDRINVFDINKDYKKVYSTAFIGDGEFVITNQDNYYYASKGTMDNVAFKKGTNVYPFEQFDLFYNRPDKIANSLVKLGIKDSTLSKAYYNAYLKRLKNIGFNEQQLSGDLHLPTLNIVNDIPVTINKDSIDISVLMTDNLHKLDRLNIWINDVPVFGSKGKSLKEKNLKELRDSYKVALSSGVNKIQLSVTNFKGLESLKKTVKVNCTAKKPKSSLYLVSIGVSEYANSDYNLEYAAKDAKDISEYTESMSSNYDKVDITILLDEEVTVENVLNIKNKLKQTKVSDVVIVFFAGHGILDSNFDYYLATHNIDFDNPSVKGLSYTNLESLLDGIPARKKLLLMDACHSGEVDKDEIEKSKSGNSENVKLGKRGAIGVQAKPNKVGLKNSFELMQMLFADLRRGTGAMVISSASGVEFAYEGEQWNNGVFTYALLNGLKSGKCDINNDGEMTVSEIRNYVIENVYKLTNGKQNPTSRKENLEFDFKAW